MQSLGGDAAQNGMTLVEEGIEGPAPRSSLSLSAGIGEDGRSGLLGPGGDVDQGWPGTACRQQHTQHLAMGILLLRIAGR